MAANKRPKITNQQKSLMVGNTLGLGKKCFDTTREQRYSNHKTYTNRFGDVYRPIFIARKQIINQFQKDGNFAALKEYVLLCYKDIDLIGRLLDAGYREVNITPPLLKMGWNDPTEKRHFNRERITTHWLGILDRALDKYFIDGHQDYREYYDAEFSNFFWHRLDRRIQWFIRDAYRMVGYEREFRFENNHVFFDDMDDISDFHVSIEDELSGLYIPRIELIKSM